MVFALKSRRSSAMVEQDTSGHLRFSDDAPAAPPPPARHCACGTRLSESNKTAICRPCGHKTKSRIAKLLDE